MSDLLNNMNNGIVPFTRIPNYFFDNYYFLLSESALKVYMAIARKTIGWRKNSDCISYSQLKKISLLSETSISKGIKELLKHALVEIKKEGRGKAEKIFYSIADKSSLQKNAGANNAPNITGTVAINASNFIENAVSNAPNSEDTKEKYIKKEEEKKEPNKDFSFDRQLFSGSIDKLLQYGLSKNQINIILRNQKSPLIQDKIEQYEYLSKNNPYKIKGKGSYLYNSIVKDWKDDGYIAYRAKLSKNHDILELSGDTISQIRRFEKLNQEYDAFLEKLSIDYLNNILPNELKELDIILESEMTSDFYKRYDKGGKIYNNLLNIKRIEYIKRKYLNSISFEEFVNKKGGLAA